MRYGLIMADPPWSFANYSAKGYKKGAQAQYDCMPLAEIKALPVSQLAARDCVLILWATNPMLNVAFDVMSAWGFQFKSSAHWVKRTKNGKIAFGTGYIVRCAGEPLLIGTIGSPRFSRSCRSVFEGLTREHSRKPDESFAWAEALVPGVERAELFARQSRSGWSTWGSEATKFDGDAA